MTEWRTRMHLRRRARRKYLGLMYQRWQADGERVHSRSREVLITLLWLLAPGVLAAVCATLLWLLRDPGQVMEVRPEFGALAVPLLVLWLLRGTVRR